MFKKVSVFIGLKIAEISAIVFVPWIAGIASLKWCQFFWEGSIVNPWVAGIITLIILIIITGFFSRFITANWKWSQKIIIKMEK